MFDDIGTFGDLESEIKFFVTTVTNSYVLKYISIFEKFFQFHKKVSNKFKLSKNINKYISFNYPLNASN